jgi:hypothetical protein
MILCCSLFSNNNGRNTCNGPNQSMCRGSKETSGCRLGVDQFIPPDGNCYVCGGYNQPACRASKVNCGYNRIFGQRIILNAECYLCGNN